ncbi:MAG TPA: hypothetical protein VJZ01_05735 [Lachnospiraceae bacterium]|jgi:hypothetical protein|nr:hypothetical protein [Lachnospiraceae bacterium]
MRRLLYTFWQCTWGILQTILGFAVFLVNVKQRHTIYHGAIVTEWKLSTSASLGLFVFIAVGAANDVHKKLLVHEYGHTIQSLLLGPFYLIVIGVPSSLWCLLPYFQNIRKKRSISYYAMYTERWANQWGEKVTGEASMGLASLR